MVARPSSRRWLSYSLLACSLLGLCYWRFASQASSPRNSKVTVILSAYRTRGLRPQWIHDTAQLYTSKQFASVVDQVILVWNEPAAAPPKLPRAVRVIRGKVNSLNNRWTLTRPHIRTEAVLVLDDDISISLPALRCLLATFQAHPDRLIGPFARRRDDNDYVLDELVALPGSEYHMILPRVMLLHVGFLAAYEGKEGMHRYVDEQAAHCDDIVLNSLAGYMTGKPPLRIALPPSSITDYTAVCGPLDRSLTAGLADQGSRWDLRTECMRHIVDGPESSLAHGSKEVAVCSADGSTYQMRRKVALPRWRAMSTLTAKELCPDLLKLDPSLPTTSTNARSGRLGLELQQYCPEVNSAMADWIDALEELPICSVWGGGRSLRIEADLEQVARSAKFQCGAWCVWDLTTSSRSGWHLKKSGSTACWDHFEEKDGVYAACDGWWWQRPRVLLDGSEEVEV